MTYSQMRALFAALARFDGRLSVLAARSQAPWTDWGVCLCDHVRRTWLCAGRVAEFAAFAHGRSAAVWAPGERPLAELATLPALHGPRMTWAEVLRVLDVLERGASRWSLAGIMATLPTQGAPRYRLALWSANGDIQRAVDSYAAFEQIVGGAAG